MKRISYFVLLVAMALGFAYAQEARSIADTTVSEPKFFVGCAISFRSEYGLKIGYLPWKMEAAIDLNYEKGLTKVIEDIKTLYEEYSAGISISREILCWQRNRVKTNFSLGLGGNTNSYQSLQTSHSRRYAGGNLFGRFCFEYIINRSFGLEVSNKSGLYFLYYYPTYAYDKYYSIGFDLISCSFHIKYYF